MKRTPIDTRRELSRAQWTLALVVLVSLVFAAFWPGIHGGFVWDDRVNVSENARVHSLSFDNAGWAFASAHGGHYQPLTWLSYMVDHATFGLDPAGYHVTNLVWHAIDSVLFALVAWQLLRTRSSAPYFAALVAGAVFALHPLRVESVTWITERRDVLCAAFFLLSILTYLQAVETRTEERVRAGWYCASILLFVISLLGKALGMALPIVLLAIDVFPLRRLERVAWTRLVLEKLPFFACAIASGLLALNAQSSVGALAGVEAHGIGARLAQACYGIVFYPRAMLALDWYPLYERPEPLDPTQTRFVLSALAVVAITIAAFAWRRRYPAVFATWISYVALIAPVSGIAQSGPQLVADRYSYLACLGFALLAGYGAGEWWGRTRAGELSRIACVGLSLAVPVYWGVRTWQQTRIWHDDASLWAHVLKIGPTALALNNAGDAADRQGDRARALEAFTQSLERNPAYPYARANVVEHLLDESLALERSTVARAAVALRRSLDALHLDDARGWFALGLARARLQDLDGANEAFERASALAPDYAPAWRKLGLVRYLRQDRAGAIAAYRKCVGLDARDADAWIGIGIAAIEGQDAPAGVDAFARATEIAPENALAWTGLGTSHWMRGDAEPARQALERALALDPNNPRASATLEQVRAGKR